MADIDVVITDATGSREQDATVPDDVPVIRLIAKLVELMELPIDGPDGQALAYKFHHKASGRQLRDEETLAQANVAPNDTLRILAEITAG